MRDRLGLCYHGVSERWPNAYAIRPGRLEDQLRHVLRRGYRPVRFTELVAGEQSGRTVAVTFDDAHRSVHEHAFPLLSRLGVTATVFTPTTYVEEDRPMVFEGYDAWLGTEFEPELQPMSWDQLEELAEAGWEIGSHTRTHPHLTRLDDGALRAETAGAKANLERRLGRECLALAYPYGDFDERVSEAARDAGYVAAAALGSDNPGAMAWPRHLVTSTETHGHFNRQVSPVVNRVRRTRAWPLASAAARAVRAAIDPRRPPR